MDFNRYGRKLILERVDHYVSEYLERTSAKTVSEDDTIAIALIMASAGHMLFKTMNEKDLYEVQKEIISLSKVRAPQRKKVAKIIRQVYERSVCA